MSLVARKLSAGRHGLPDFLAGKTQKQRPDEAQAPPSGWALFRNLLGNVRVLIAQSKHYLCFKAFHLFRFVVFDMIVAQQMQATVHHHMRQCASSGLPCSLASCSTT
ncbi:Uncharacterised protein [Klebsiella pneumoniae subsp. ozaenae]|uniref:Uncharacterized protein n=1 Tax=Klebsiella pneumoniae subsp. ozaenae TaxID=574 RepID=A0A377Z715_KLEPO|nr:Uncharacterised protein [Klebsiella pneumoniae subsp. ozaenae]